MSLSRRSPSSSPSPAPSTSRSHWLLPLRHAVGRFSSTLLATALVAALLTAGRHLGIVPYARRGWLPANASQQWIVTAVGLAIAMAAVAWTRSRRRVARGTSGRLGTSLAWVFVLGALLALGVAALALLVVAVHAVITQAWTEAGLHALAVVLATPWLLAGGGLVAVLVRLGRVIWRAMRTRRSGATAATGARPARVTEGDAPLAA